MGRRKSRVLLRMLTGAVLISLAVWGGTGKARGETLTVNPECAPMGAEETRAMVERASEEFFGDPDLKAELRGELTQKTENIPAVQFGTAEWDFYVLTHRGKSMRFFMEIIGEPDGNGRYPLYIALHGGGGGPEEQNNDQWIDMAGYYSCAVERGIYVACRGITDTWDLHFQEDSYPLYDRLIEAMVVLYGADPDRVYLLGFSAGGDGVYQIAPRLADRFAAANMSSGHPNGVRLLNLANCPICLQAGIRDYYSEDARRSVRAAEFEGILSGYREQYGFGYEHRVLIHVPEGHNFNDSGKGESRVLKDPARFADPETGEFALAAFLRVLEERTGSNDVGVLSYFLPQEDPAFNAGIAEVVQEQLGLETTEEDTNAVNYVSQFRRNSAPEKIVWDLSTRAGLREKNSFYWLEAGPEANRGVITVSFDRESNTITAEPDAEVNGDFAILFHPALVDVSRPVILKTGTREVTIQINPSEAFLKASMHETGDPGLACVGKILYSEITK